MPWAALAGSSAYAYWGLQHIPFSSAEPTVKALVAVLLTAPAGVACGMLLPAGLARIPKTDYGAAFLLDSLGAAGGFLLFQCIAILWGITWALPAAALAYAAALFFLR